VYKEKYGPWAVILGGSEGVGAELARALAQDGVNLLLVARRAEPLEVLKRSIIDQAPVEVRELALDITEPEAADRIAAAVADVEIGMLICNAGSGVALGAFIAQDVEAHLRLVQLNITSQIRLIHHFGRLMADRQRGAIMLIGSGAGEVGTGYVAVYSASKAFQRHLAEALWFELAPQGIDVSVMMLGVTKTPQLGRKGYPVDDPDAPGADPRDVALACLDAIGNGPVVHLNETVDIVEDLKSKSRKDVVRVLSERAGKVLGNDLK